MAYGRDEGTEQPSTPPRTPRVNPRYPVAKPITSPSPALSVSQLGNSPWNGGSILFDSDQSEVGKANGADLVLQAGRNSRNTFGSIRLSTPTRSNSEHSLGPHEILASSEPPVAAPERPLSHENSEPGEQNSRRASHASKRASEASHVSSIYPFSPPGLLANISNPTSPEPNIKPRNSSEVEDKDHAVTLKDGGAPVVAAPGVSPASSSVPRHTTSKDIRPSASTSVSIQGPVFSIKRKPPPSVDDYSKAEGTRGRESGVEPILEHPFRLAAASSSTHNPPVLAPSSSLGPTLASSLSPSNRAPRNQVLKPRTTTTAPALKLRPKTSAGERRKIPLSAMPLNDKTCLPAFNAPQAQRIYHPHSGNLVGASNKLSTSTSSSVTSLSSPDEPSHVAARDFIIFIHIDQERFREVSPAFIFHRFQKGDRLPGSNGGDVQEKPENFLGRAIVQDQKAKSDRSDSIGLVGSSSRGTHARLAESSRSVLVEYKMSGTDSFCFHHSALDSSPTLRKLTVNGDSKYDYLSREAALVLKTNGMYTVKASELKGAAMWQFTYLVDDKRNSAGDRIPGEKLLTPLSFVCSAGFLSPDRCKKSSFLFGMKKSILPKIVATKIEALPTAGDPARLGALSSRLHQSPHVPSLAISEVPSASTQKSSIPLLSSVHNPQSRPSTAPKRPSTSGGLRSLSKSLSISNLFEKAPRPLTSRGRPSTPRFPTVKRPATADGTKRLIISSPIGPPTSLPNPASSGGPASSSLHVISFDRPGPVLVNQQRGPPVVSSHDNIANNETGDSDPIVRPIASKEQIRLWLASKATDQYSSANSNQKSLVAPPISLDSSTPRIRTASPVTLNSVTDNPRSPTAATGGQPRSPTHSSKSSCPPPPRSGATVRLRQRPSTANELSQIPSKRVPGQLRNNHPPRPQTASTTSSTYLDFPLRTSPIV